MDFKNLIEDADTEISETIDHLADCLRNHSCSLMTKILLGQVLIEIKKTTKNANKKLAKMFDSNFGKED